MTGKFKFLTATIALSASVLLAAGVTLAVVVTDNNSSGTLVAGNLKLSAQASNVQVYSAIPALATDSNVFYDEHEKPYKYELSTLQGNSEKIYFSRHNGSVSFNEKSISIDGMMPGDKVEFDIAVTSASTISFNYRAELYVDSTEGETLLNQLDFSAGKLGLLRKSLSDGAAKEGSEERLPAVLTDYTEWSTFSGNQTSIENVHLTISLPIDSTEGQGETVKFYYVASGMQNMEQQPDVARIEAGGQTYNFKTLADAVTYAEESGANLIKIIGNTVLEEGSVAISNAMTIEGVPDEQGVLPVLKGVRLTVADGAAVTLEKIRFGDDSYIDVSNATALTMNGCVADGNAVRYFDTVTRTYLQDPAFIVSGSTLTPNRLILTDNTFNLTNGAAVNLRTRLQNGSYLTGNKIGSTQRVYGGTAAVLLSGAEEEATLKLTDNTVYAKNAFSLGERKGARFTVVSRENTAYLSADGKFAGGTANAAFIDGGSTNNEKALALSDIAHEGLMFGCTDAVLDNLQRISSGKIAISSTFNYTEFFLQYASAGTIAKNALALYENGVLVGYINSANNENGYIVDPVNE